MERILIIRGGATGDFILTLPAIRVLRAAKPDAQIDILGYKHVAELANKRFYADNVRSIESSALSRFFANDSELPLDLQNYFAGFDLIISYLFDPDHILENNLRRCSVRRIVCGPAKISSGGEHAARQLAKPLEQLGLKLHHPTARIYPSPADRKFARDFLAGCRQPVIALHPGSGSEKKNWPLQNWTRLGGSFLSSADFAGSIVVISGEADIVKTARLKSTWSDSRVRFAENLTLPHVGAVLEQTTFIGHDSGISHLAAAAGADCILLFGPTDPAVWAPQGDNVQVMRAPEGELSRLPVQLVCELIRERMSKRTREGVQPHTVMR